jgi:hypothetical protein
MRIIAIAAAVSIGAWAYPQDEPPVPKELESPRVAPGAAADFLKTFAKSDELSRRLEGRHAALILLETMPDTRAYLGTPIAKLLRDSLKQALLEDVRASAWVDKT